MADFQYQDRAEPLVDVAAPVPDFFAATTPLPLPRQARPATDGLLSPFQIPVPVPDFFGPQQPVRIVPRRVPVIGGQTHVFSVSPLPAVPDQPWEPVADRFRRKRLVGGEFSFDFGPILPVVIPPGGGGGHGGGPPPGKGKGHDKPDKRAPVTNLAETFAYLYNAASSTFFLSVGLTALEPILPPTLPARPARRTAESGIVAPVYRPLVPFDAAQQVATLPHPARLVRRPYWIHTPAGAQAPDESIFPIPPGQWYPQLRDLPVLARLRPVGGPASRNVDPITPTPAPDQSWAGSFPDLLVRPPSAVSRQSVFAQNLEPITTPAYLASFWLHQLPSGPFPKPGLKPPQQSSFAPLPTEGPAVLPFQAWRSTYPALMLRPRWIVPPDAVLPPEVLVIAAGVSCIMLTSPAVAASTLIDPALTTSTLTDPDWTAPTLSDPEVC